MVVFVWGLREIRDLIDSCWHDDEKRRLQVEDVPKICRKTDLGYNGDVDELNRDILKIHGPCKNIKKRFLLLTDHGLIRTLNMVRAASERSGITFI